MSIDRRKIKTKAIIKEVALNEMLEKNYSQITVKDIAMRANIERKTFYLHFSCIEDVVTEIMKELEVSFTNNMLKYISDNNGYNIKDIFFDISKFVNLKKPLLQRIAMNDSYSFVRVGFENILKNDISLILTNVYKNTKPHQIHYATFYASGITKLYVSWLRGEIAISEKELSHILSRCCFSSFEELIAG